MTQFSLAELYGITIRESATDGSDFTSPSVDYRRLYLGEDGQLHLKDSAGALTHLTPGYEYAYTQFTASVNLTATTEGTANTVVTASAVTFDGVATINIIFQAPHTQIAGDANARSVNYWLYEDGTSIGRLGSVQAPATNTAGVMPCHYERRMTPASGSRTYSIRGSVNGGTSICVAGAGGAAAILPGFIRIVRAA